ncbi:MAG: hypothetical protein ACRDK2_08175 [Solirubrobacteraceae bacterium]
MRRNPVLSETDAFRLTVTGAAIALIGALVGWLTTPLAGVAAFVVLGLVGLGLYMRGEEPGRRLPLRRAAADRHPHRAAPGTRRVIVVANDTLAGEELSRHIRELHGRSVQLDVLAPVLASRTRLAYTDIDSGIERARERLSLSLAWARTQGFAARGEVGDASPVAALEDELRDFGADEVIVATSGSEPSSWQERTELQRLREELDIPVVQVSVEVQR